MKFDPSRQRDIVIIGGGIVGVATAALLAESGREVLVIDRSGICEETSLWARSDLSRSAPLTFQR
jgi:D-amino-acid dehydrogenase